MLKIISTLFSRYSLVLVGSLLLSNFITYQFLMSTKKDVQVCEALSLAQDQAIEAISVHYEERLKERKVITVKDIQTKLKIVYKDHNVTKEECNEVFSVIDAIRYSDL